ncbi:MAG: hypothetical protein V1769_06135 [Thermoplasmatota archaeon]|jgi:hypothetical protein
MKEKERYEKYPSLFTYFKPGERVSRNLRNDEGELEVYEGIIMALDDDRMEIYWDTLDGKYRPEVIEKDFTMCHVDEVLHGTENYSPIKRKKHSYIDG